MCDVLGTRLPLRDNAVTRVRARARPAHYLVALVGKASRGYRRSLRLSENPRNGIPEQSTPLRADVRPEETPLSRTSPGSAGRHLLCRARTAAYGDGDDDAVEILFITRRRRHHLFVPVHAEIVSVPGRNWSARKNLSIRALYLCPPPLPPASFIVRNNVASRNGRFSTTPLYKYSYERKTATYSHKFNFKKKRRF